jgi:hypothetical protein
MHLLSDKNSAPSIYITAMRKSVIAVVGIVALLTTSPAQAVTGTHGETLSVSKNMNIKSGEKLIVTGQHFDETIGIYVAMCTVVKKGVLPSPCGGGIDETGASGASVWISSNPPSYGVGLAKPFLPGGRFSVSLKVSPMIGKLDCRKIKCAIYVRADHTRGDDRTHDLFVPISFKK